MSKFLFFILATSLVAFGSGYATGSAEVLKQKKVITELRSVCDQ